MIIYKKLRLLMKEKGLTTYKIRKDNIISQRALSSIIHDQSITMETVNKLCAALDCQPGDILEYIKDPPEETPGEDRTE